MNDTTFDTGLLVFGICGWVLTIVLFGILAFNHFNERRQCSTYDNNSITYVPVRCIKELLK